MKIGEAIYRLRKDSSLSQSELAERVGVSFQAVSSWERGEYLPDLENIRKLAQVFHVPPSEIIDEEERPAFARKDRIFSEEHMYTFVKTTALAKGLENTARALPFMRAAHAGQFRKANDGSSVPYIYHPLLMACHALAMGIQEDEVIAALLLHDVIEDCGKAAEDLPVSDAVRKTVLAVTKTAEEDNDDLPKVQNEMLTQYYGRISQRREAMLVKLLDRCNNLSEMAMGFTRKRMAEYIEETEIYILPMLERLRASSPELSSPLFLLKYQMVSLMESLKRVL